MCLSAPATRVVNLLWSNARKQTSVRNSLFVNRKSCIVRMKAGRIDSGWKPPMSKVLGAIAIDGISSVSAS